MSCEDKQWSSCLDLEAADCLIHRPGEEGPSAVISRHGVNSSEMTTECPHTLGCLQRPRLGRAVARTRHDQHVHLLSPLYSRYNDNSEQPTVCSSTIGYHSNSWVSCSMILRVWVSLNNKLSCCCDSRSYCYRPLAAIAEVDDYLLT